MGETMGNKSDPNQVSKDIRNARKENGERRFQREEWLTKMQIKGYFSRLAKQRRNREILQDDFDVAIIDDDEGENQKI